MWGISISRETAATLLSDMSSITVDSSKAGGKEKTKKDKPKKKGNAMMPDNGTEFIFDEFTDGISRNSSWEGVDHGNGKDNHNNNHNNNNNNQHNNNNNNNNEMIIRDNDDNMKDPYYQNNRGSFSINSNNSSSSNLCGNNGIKSRNGSAIGMSLPSHLRPPLIVTVGGNGGGNGPLANSICTTTGTSEDHLLLVELLSNMKSSPKWGQQDTYVPVAPHVHIAPTPYDRKRLQQVQSGNGNYAVHFNGNGNGHESKGADYGIGYNNSRGGSSKRLKVEGQTESSMPWKRSSDEVATPTDRALKRVRAELKRRDRQKAEGLEQGQGRSLGAMSGLGNGHSDGHMTSQSGAPDRDRDVVPFQLLPFFEYLVDHAQR